MQPCMVGQRLAQEVLRAADIELSLHYTTWAAPFGATVLFGIRMIRGEIDAQRVHNTYPTTSSRDQTAD